MQHTAVVIYCLAPPTENTGKEKEIPMTLTASKDWSGSVNVIDFFLSCIDQIWKIFSTNNPVYLSGRKGQ